MSCQQIEQGVFICGGDNPGRVWLARLRRKGERRFWKVTEHKSQALAEAALFRGIRKHPRDVFHGDVAFADPCYSPSTVVEIFRR